MYLEMFTTMGAIIGATITTRISSVYLYFFFAAFLSTSFLKWKGSKGKDLIYSPSQNKVSTWLDLQGCYFDEATQTSIAYRVQNRF